MSGIDGNGRLLTSVKKERLGMVAVSTQQKGH